MSITCPACGYENADNVDFCEACGNEIVASQGSAPTQLQPEPVAATGTNIESMPVDLDFSSPNSSFDDPFSAMDLDFSSPNPASNGSSSPEVTPPPVASSTAKLVAKRSNFPISEFVLDGSAIAGRFDPDTGPVDIDLEGFPGEETISRNHAEFYFEGGQWKVKDLGSTNGVFIRRAGQNRFSARITTPEVLNAGDEIAIAKICFLFQS